MDSFSQTIHPFKTVKKSITLHRKKIKVNSHILEIGFSFSGSDGRFSCAMSPCFREAISPLGGIHEIILFAFFRFFLYTIGWKCPAAFQRKDNYNDLSRL
jgi:hypothetical protein